MKEYVNIPREKRLKKIILGQSLVTFCILAISVWLVFFGFGYKINWKTLSITHTGIVYLTFVPKDADVYMNDQAQGKSSPFTKNLTAGYYNFSVRKVGYQPWQENIKVENDRVVSNKNITLFRENPEVQIVSDQNSKDSIDAPYDSLVKNPQGNLYSNNYEIWNDNDLVTRFSVPVSNVIWYPGGEYIGFQQGKEIRIIRKNGTNDIKLATLSSATQTKFLFSWDGSSLLYKDGLEYKKVIIN